MTQNEIRLYKKGYNQHGVYSSMLEAKREAKRIRKCGYAATVYTDRFGDSLFFVVWAKKAGDAEQTNLEMEKIC